MSIVNVVLFPDGNWESPSVNVSQKFRFGFLECFDFLEFCSWELSRSSPMGIGKFPVVRISKVPFRLLVFGVLQCQLEIMMLFPDGN